MAQTGDQLRSPASSQQNTSVSCATTMQGEVMNCAKITSDTDGGQRMNNIALVAAIPNGYKDRGDNIYTISGSNGENGGERIQHGCQNLKRKHEEELKMKRSGFVGFFCGPTRKGPTNLHLLLAEFIGTGLLLFIGCMGCITDYEPVIVQHYMPSLTFGLTVMIIIQMFGHISGAHLNPAVTMVTVLNGMIELKSAPFYLLGQFAGAIAGLGGLKLLVPESYLAREKVNANNETVPVAGMCTTYINKDISSVQALIVEVIITFILIWVCCSIWDKRNGEKQDSVPLRFGLVISAIGMAAGPFSGGSMNTARSFAPALLNNDWDHQWIYWLGPTLGALISYYTYRFIYAVPANDDDKYDPVELNSMAQNDANKV